MKAFDRVFCLILSLVLVQQADCRTLFFKTGFNEIRIEQEETAIQQEIDKDIKIFTCLHKSFTVPEGEVIVPIHVGRVNAKEKLNMIGDDSGENISFKNPFFCELTATYWIWKNVKSDIVGLCHYRRYFNLAEDSKLAGSDFCKNFGLTKQNIRSIFKNFDIILPQKTKAHKNYSLYDLYARAHVKSDLDVVLDVIKEKYPDQYKIAYFIFHSTQRGYFYNMLIARKEIFDDYAAWLFSVLFEVEKRIQNDVLKRDPYQRRAYGFLAERLMIVYIALHPELRVKEVPVLFVESDHFSWYEKLFIKLVRAFSHES